MATKTLRVRRRWDDACAKAEFMYLVSDSINGLSLTMNQFTKIHTIRIRGVRFDSQVKYTWRKLVKGHR